MIVYSGLVTGQDIAAQTRAVQADSRYGSIRYIIHDLSNAGSISYLPTEIEELASRDSAASLVNPSHKVVVIPDRDDVRRLLQAYLQVGLQSAERIRLFPDIESGRHWTDQV
jgi:hypothetical protein